MVKCNLSRKIFLSVNGDGPESRLPATMGATVLAIQKGVDLDATVAALETQLVADAVSPVIPTPPSRSVPATSASTEALSISNYSLGDSVATREAYGTALAELGRIDSRVVALDADVGNSTFSEKFERVHADRFFQTHIAEQVMVGAAMGLASRGAVPFPSTFACFLTRASDFVRMAGISRSNIKFAGSHAGISIGEDGPSQMALEDMAMMRAVPNCAVLYPCDGVSAERLVESAVRYDGMVYLRTSRPKTPVIYSQTEAFPVGGSKVLRQSEADVATIVAAGITVFEALTAYDHLQGEGISIRVIDAYSVQPVDAESLVTAGLQTGFRLITVEDHYPVGGLGDAVSEAVADHGITVTRLAVREIPRSGKPKELLDRYGISSSNIIGTVHRQIATEVPAVSGNS